MDYYVKKTFWDCGESHKVGELYEPRSKSEAKALLDMGRLTTEAPPEPNGEPPVSGADPFEGKTVAELRAALDEILKGAPWIKFKIPRRATRPQLIEMIGEMEARATAGPQENTEEENLESEESENTEE